MERKMRDHIVVGSRESALAVIQSEMVCDYIRQKHPELTVSLLTMKTTGDRILDRTLDQAGGKGLFVKELDMALMEGRSQLSVHSLKDMPMEVSEELPLLAFSKREDPRDVLVLPEGKTELDPSLPLGCSSFRRQLQLKELYPEMEVKSIRGNLQTRLRKLEEGQYSGLILAAAGLKRLGLEHRISRYFSPEEMIPAAGQGILAVQGIRGEDYSFLEGFNDRKAELEAMAERAFVRYLNGGCSSPIAAFSELEGEELLVRGLYYDEKSGNWEKGSVRGKAEDAVRLGESLAETLRSRCGKKTGKVWLVGAGPGDLGLFTLKGMEVLKKAEVVVYDSLVGQEVLLQIPDSAKLIYVGKRAGCHTMRQEKINEALAEEALKGNRVVRLKGGDPFLFGRGGEELELLTEKGIPYEVVPGVTSSLAVPAYNGIPVTHRDFCSSLHIITGHKRAGQKLDIDFETLVKTGGTLVFLMGAGALEDIMKGLLEGGMDPDMPAAILEKGTTAGQRRIVATISTLKAEADRQKIGTPAIIVVGKVCSLSEKFAWRERLPLAGWKVLVTRPKNLVSRTAALLREKGAEVLELPAIRTEEIRESDRLREAIAKLDKYQWLVFTSPTGAEIFFRRMQEEGRDIRALGACKIAVIGEGTSRKLKEYGLFADLMPEIYDGDSLGEVLAKVLDGTERILIPRAEKGNEHLTELLRKTGAQVDDIATYHTVYEKSILVDEKKELEEGNIDCVVFTSASTVKGFVEGTGCGDYSGVRAACIGRQTCQAAASYGMQTYTAEKATIESLIELVIRMKEEDCGK